MSPLYIVCLIIIGGCTAALIWSSIYCMYWTNRKIKLLREIQRRVTTEEDALDCEKKNEGKEDRP